MKKFLSLLLILSICLSLFCSLIPVSNAAYSPLKLEPGHFVRLGYYEQDDNPRNGKEPILWTILDIRGDDVVLISYYALDLIDFDSVGGEVSYDNSSLRTWLNETFYYEAFDMNDQELIVVSDVKADENGYYGRSFGSSTVDNVFILSTNEIQRYMPYDYQRICLPTAYTKNKGAWTDEETGQCWWTTRTTGENNTKNSLVHWEGDIFWRGDKTENGNPIRPCIRLSYSALESYASRLNNDVFPHDFSDQPAGLMIPFDVIWLSGEETLYVGRKSIKRTSWHVYGDEPKEDVDANYGLTKNSEREKVRLLGMYEDVDGKMNYLVTRINAKDTRWFWVRETRLNTTP